MFLVVTAAAHERCVQLIAVFDPIDRVGTRSAQAFAQHGSQSRRCGFSRRSHRVEIFRKRYIQPAPLVVSLVYGTKG